MMKTIPTAMAAAMLLSLLPTTAGTDSTALVEPIPVDDVQVHDEELLDLLDDLVGRKCRSCEVTCLLGSCTACCARPLEPSCTCDLAVLLPRCTCV